MKIPDVQGHRGCRGYLPENTIPAFLEALRLGVTTLEMDVVITADNQVLVSHEPFMSHEYCLDADGNAISDGSALSYNIYRMTYEEVLKYDCGSKKHPRFPQQQKLKITKPLLSDVIAVSETFAQMESRQLPLYNIEIKSTKEGDDIFHPLVSQFATLVMEVITKFGIQNRTTIQSFDLRALQYLKSNQAPVKLSLLSENNRGAEQNIIDLGFLPDYYSPAYILTNAAEIDRLHALGVGILPWTINNREDMEQFLDLGVDGIITDYPALLLEIIAEKG